MPKRNDWGISPKSPLAQGSGPLGPLINRNQSKQLDEIDEIVEPAEKPVEYDSANDPDGRARWARTKRRLGIRRQEP